MKRTNSFTELFGNTNGNNTENLADLLENQTNKKKADSLPDLFDSQTSTKNTDGVFDLFGDQIDSLFSSGAPAAFTMNLEETPVQQEIVPLLNSEYWYQDNDINTVLAAYLYENQWLSPQKRFLLTDPSFGLFIDADDNNPYIVAITPAVDTIGSTPIQYFLDKNHQASNALSTILKLICDRNLNQQLQLCQKSKRHGQLRKLFPQEKDADTIKAIAVALEEANFNLTQLRNKIDQLDANDKRLDVFDEIMPGFLLGDYARARILCPMSLSQRHWVIYEIVLMREQSIYDITVTAHDPYGYGEVGQKELSLLKAALTKRITDFHPGVQPDITITTVMSAFPPRQHPDDKSSCGAIIVNDILLRIAGKPLGGSDPYPVGALSLRTAQYQHTVNQVNANKEADITGFKNRILAKPVAATTNIEKAKATTTTRKKREPKKSLQDDRSSKKSKEDPKVQKKSSSTQPQPKTTVQSDSFTTKLVKAFVKDEFTGNLQLGYWTKDNHFIYFVDTETQQALQTNNMDMQALFNKVCEIMYQQNEAGASRLKIIFFSSIDTPFKDRTEAYSCTILDYQMNVDKRIYEPAKFILIDPFHYKKFPNKPKLESAPTFLSTILQACPSQVTTLDNIGSRATKYAFTMALYVSILYAFKNQLVTEIPEEFKNKLVTYFAWSKLSVIIGESHLLQIKDNHANRDNPFALIFTEPQQNLIPEPNAGESAQGAITKSI